jgi:hypothetical protein
VLLVAGLVVVLGLTTVVVLAATEPAAPASAAPAPAPAFGDPGDVEQVVAPAAVSEDLARRLPQVTTNATLPTAPRDPSPDAITAGRIVHAAVPVPVYAAPGGPAIAMLPPTQQFGKAVTETEVPVIAEQPGWAQVLLPVRPNSSTGWIYLDGQAVATEHSAWRIDVDRARFTATVLHDGAVVGQWRVGVGKPGSVTPAGRTFLLSGFQEEHPTYSPVILPLGAHSDTYTSYGGGPGTVAVHTWPTSSVYGRAASDGCVRVPRDALDLISTQVPLGTVVRIS